MAKSAQRFDYARFGEALVERGLIDRDVLIHVMNQCNASRGLLPEILVRENLVSDWEVSRVSCELYHLPFLTVDQYPPANTALDGYDLNYLRHYALVPLDRYGALVTVIMPGLVPSEVLEGLRTSQSGRVLPVVGSVVSNRRWLAAHMAPPQAPGQPAGAAKPGAATTAAAGRGAPATAAAPQGKTPAPQGKAPARAAGPVPGPLPGAGQKSGQPSAAASAASAGGEEDWSNIFDAGDEAVQLDLKKPSR